MLCSRSPAMQVYGLSKLSFLLDELELCLIFGALSVRNPPDHPSWTFNNYYLQITHHNLFQH